MLSELAGLTQVGILLIASLDRPRFHSIRRSPTRCVPTAFPYKTQLADPKITNGYQKQDPTTKVWSYSWGATAEITDRVGTPGQGENANPRAMFTNHVVATFNGVIYDASYGLKYDTVDKWEEGAVAGYSTPTALPGKEDEYQWFFVKNTKDDNAWTLVAIPGDVAFPGPGANDTTSTLGSRKDTKPH